MQAAKAFYTVGSPKALEYNGGTPDGVKITSELLVEMPKFPNERRDILEIDRQLRSAKAPLVDDGSNYLDIRLP